MRNLSPQRSPNDQDSLQEQAKAAYQTGEFEEALQLYRSALSSAARDKRERQILLSNIVACRLNIGGKAQAEAAIENAKQCIALNDQWAKGHVRLAEAYIALGGGCSNDACNSLQRAIQLDPGHPTARQMLVRELRRDHRNSAAASSHVDVYHEGSRSEEPSNNDAAETDRSTDTANRESSAPPPPSSSQSTSTPRVFDDVDDPAAEGEDSSLSFFDHLQMQLTKTIRWYHAQSEDRRKMIHVALLLLLLYVAFGGRFGLEQQGYGRTASYRKGNYGRGNAYDEFYGRHGSSTSSHHRNYHSNTYNNREYSSYQSQSSTSSNSGEYNSSGSFLDQWNGHLTPIMLLLLGGTYLCHRNGIPIADTVSYLVGALVFRRRRYRRGWGGGMGGGRFRPRYQYRR